MNYSTIAVKTIEAHIIKGFVTDGMGGNPAGVVLDAGELNEAEMLSIAAK